PFSSGVKVKYRQLAVHKQIVSHLDAVDAWFANIRKDLDVPFYSSYDIRDFGHKVVTVDANIYPAGFNNICPTDKEASVPLVKRYIERHYGANAKKILVLTEEHTGNPYYWDNIASLKRMIVEAGFQVEIAFPRMRTGEAMTMASASAGDVVAYAAVIRDGRIVVEGFEPDVVISNNDFSEAYAEWGPIKSALNPPRELGWYQRKKSTFFKHYNRLATEFAQAIEVDPWEFTVETELFENFDMGDDASKEALALRVEAMIARLKVQYEKRGIKEDPVLFVKNNSGTYGLAVMRVQSGDDVRALNYKTRKKMKAAKGGRDVEEVIIQEGVPSIVQSEGGVTAEPTIYLVGCQLAGGFLRTHAEKGPTESLNSPGAVYKRLCVADLKVSVEGNPMENVYGWIAKLGVLAIGLESAEMKVQYQNYTRMTSC
ncbi:MAG: glutamate--cysteine ligase, partial [Bdellovibrionota bacterium]